MLFRSAHFSAKRFAEHHGEAVVPAVVKAFEPAVADAVGVRRAVEPALRGSLEIKPAHVDAVSGPVSDEPSVCRPFE